MAFECPRGTRFQQRTMVCDHEHLVQCHNSEQYFHSNLRIGQANLNFIDDRRKSKFHFPPLQSSSGFWASEWSWCTYQRISSTLFSLSYLLLLYSTLIYFFRGRDPRKCNLRRTKKTQTWKTFGTSLLLRCDDKETEFYVLCASEASYARFQPLF